VGEQGHSDFSRQGGIDCASFYINTPTGLPHPCSCGYIHVATYLASPEAVEALAEAIHNGQLDNGEVLCSWHGKPLDSCPVAPHQRHARAILAAWRKRL
jgi:hypothetical protein